MKKHIVLIGPRASGKSSLGYILAKKLNLKFIDLDNELIKIAKVESMKEVFTNKGEEWLAENEQKLLRKILKKPNKLVIATGGRTISRGFQEIKQQNIKILKENSILVFPKASKESYWERILMDWQKNHSHLSLDKLKDQFEIGMTYMPIFNETADIIIQTDQKSLTDSCEEIISNLTA